MDKHYYSLAFMPSGDVSTKVATMKKELQSYVGWYSSCNSKAHITVLEFYGSQSELSFVKQKLVEICAREPAFDAVFDDVSCSLQTKCAVLRPNKIGRDRFSKLMKIIRRSLRSLDFQSGSGAHISIGRHLTETQLKVSQYLFPKVDLGFRCSDLAIRKFNEDRGQFDVIEIFTLNGINRDGIQTSMF